MKYLNIAITSIILSLSLSSCGGTTIEAAQDPQGVDNGGSLRQVSSLSLSSSAGDFGSVESSSSVQLYLTGGTSPYTFELLSGDGSFNESSLSFVAGSEGTVGIRVTDGDGDTSEHYFYVVATGTIIDPSVCVSASETVAAQNASDLEVLVKLGDHAETADQVIVGIGMRAHDDDVLGLYVKTETLNADGTMDESSAKAVTSGDLWGLTGELFVEAPQGYFVYGVGAASSATGNTVVGIKLYVAKAVTASSDFDLMECTTFKEAAEDEVTTECVSSSDLPSSMDNRYYEFMGRSNKPLADFGTALNDFAFDRMAAGSKTLTFGDCE